MSKLRIIRYGAIHLDSEINSGDPEVDEFFQNAFKHESEGISRVYVGSIDDVVVAFYALATSLVRGEVKGSREGKWPSILLGQLGVDRKYQKKGIGEKMVEHAIKKAKEISKSVGCRLFILETYKEDLVNDFYIKKLGFSVIRVVKISEKGGAKRYTLYKDLSN